MAIAYKSAGAGFSTATGLAQLQGACPATVDANDILIAHTAWNDTASTPSTPSGWTLLYGPQNIGTTPEGRHWVFGKIAAGTEDGATIQFGSPGGTNKRWGRIYSFSGYVSGTIDQITDGFSNQAHATDPQMPSVTTTEAGALAVALVAQNDDNAVAAATGATGGTWAEAVAEYTATTGTGVMMQLQTCTPTANPGTVSGGSSATTNDPCGVIGFEIRATAPSLSATVNKVTETDTSQPITRTKIKTLGQATETGTARAITRVKTKIIGQTTEADAARAITVGGAGGLTRTDLLGQLSTESWGTGAFTSNSFTPPDNSLLVVVGWGTESGASTDPSGDLTISGGGLTFTPRFNFGAFANYAMGIRVWTAPVTTGASMTLQIDAGTRDMFMFGLAAFAYTGANASSPIGATGTLSDGTVPDGAKSLTLNAAPASTSEVIGVVHHDKESGGTTPGSAFTELYDLFSGNFAAELEVRGGSTSTTVDWVDVFTGGGGTFKLVAIGFEVKKASSGQTVAVNKITETDAAQPITRLKSRAVAQATETDAARQILRVESVGQATETDTARTITKIKTRAVAQTTEADTSFAIARFKVKAVGQATSTSTAQPITRLKSRIAGQATEVDAARLITVRGVVRKATETDTAFAITPLKTRALGQATEVDVSQTVARLKARTLGQTIEVDTARQILRIESVGQALESDTSRAITRVKTKAANQATESDTARAITRAKNRVLGQATEVDTARVITRPGNLVGTVNQATEADNARGITRVKLRVIGQATEADVAQPISRVKTKTVAQTAETDAARAVTRTKIKVLGQALETDAARLISVRGVVRKVTETDAAQPVVRLKTKINGQTAETDVARAITRVKARTVSQTTETDVARVITRTGQIIGQVGKVSEADTARAITALKTKIVSKVVETDLARTMTRVRTYTVSKAAETDTARQVARVLRLSKPTETDVALAIIRVKTKIVSNASETDLARGISRVIRIGKATETDSAGTISPDSAFSVEKVIEVDVARPIAHSKIKILGKATEREWEFAWPIKIVIFRGTADELTVQRRHTLAFINTTPVMITLTPRWKIKQPTGGYRLADQGPRPPQKMLLVTPRAGERTIRTVDGIQRETEKILIGRWDASIAVDDRFTYDGENYVVVAIMEPNGWEQRAEVVQIG